MQITTILPQWTSKEIRYALGILCATWSLHAPAQNEFAVWKPGRPVTIVVPYAPGGGTDATTRAVARRLSEYWGQPVVVQNIAGADGLIGTRHVIDAKPDGLTLLVQVPSVLLMRYQTSLNGVDPLAHLQPVSLFATASTAVVVGGASPIKSLQQLAAFCQRPGAVCSAGSGENNSKLDAKNFASAYGLRDLAIISYKGTSQIIPDLVAGNVTVAFTGLTAALPLHKSGKLRIISTGGDRRAIAVPEVPTGAESGWKDSYSITWYGMFAPEGTSNLITDSIAAAVREVGKFEDVRKAVELAGAEPSFSTRKEFIEQIQRDSHRLAGLVEKYPLE